MKTIAVGEHHIEYAEHLFHGDFFKAGKQGDKNNNLINKMDIPSTKPEDIFHHIIGHVHETDADLSGALKDHGHLKDEHLDHFLKIHGGEKVADTRGHSFHAVTTHEVDGKHEVHVDGNPVIRFAASLKNNPKVVEAQLIIQYAVLVWNFLSIIAALVSISLPKITEGSGKLNTLIAALSGKTSSFKTLTKTLQSIKDADSLEKKAGVIIQVGQFLPNVLDIKTILKIIYKDESVSRKVWDIVKILATMALYFVSGGAGVIAKLVRLGSLIVTFASSVETVVETGEKLEQVENDSYKIADVKAGEPVLKLLTLKCNKTQDLIGADEAYLLFDGNKIWSGSIKDGESIILKHQGKTLQVPVQKAAGLELYDKDFFTKDDRIGGITISPDQAGQGEKTTSFKENRGDYLLTYIIEEN